VRDVILGLVAGLLLGIGLALLLHRLDRRLRDGSDAESIFRRPVLGVIPESRALQKMGKMLDLCEPEGEAFRAIRTNLRYFAIDQGARSLLITSHAPSEGKSTAARFLAATAAASGTRVVLLEADLRRPTVAGIFVGLREHGLTNVLAGQASLTEVVQRLPISRRGFSDTGIELDVVAAGPVPPNPTDLLSSDRMRDVLAELEQRYELVIVDTSPISLVPDAIPLLHHVSGVVVLVRSGRTTKHGASSLHRQLENLAITPLGLIVNGGASPRHGAYYNYYGIAAADPGDATTAEAPESPKRTDPPRPFGNGADAGSVPKSRRGPSE